jgi:uncharacterized damage-inducible protein DinB
MPMIAFLLAALDEGYDRKSWHGTNLRGSLRGLTPEQVVWRPGKGRHNVQEIAVHAAYWKYVVRRALAGEKRGTFGYSGSNWFPRERPDPAQWKADLELLGLEHRRLLETVAGFDPARLDERFGTKGTYAGLIRGVVAHDVYHAGQIQLLKRLNSRI